MSPINSPRLNEGLQAQETTPLDCLDRREKGWNTAHGCAPKSIPLHASEGLSSPTVKIGSMEATPLDCLDRQEKGWNTARGCAPKSIPLHASEGLSSPTVKIGSMEATPSFCSECLISDDRTEQIMTNF